MRHDMEYTLHVFLLNKTRNSAIAEKPRDALKGVAINSVIKYLNMQVFKYYLNTVTGI